MGFNVLWGSNLDEKHSWRAKPYESEPEIPEVNFDKGEGEMADKLEVLVS